MTNEQLRKQYEQRAKNERGAGAVIQIDLGLPSVYVKRSDGTEYYFQGREADIELDAIPDWINAEDFILAQSQNW